MSQALKQVRDQAKAMGTHISSHVLPSNSPSARPGLTTRQTGSPQLTPRAEREQPVVPPLDPSGTATAASPAPQAGPPQATRKSQSKGPPSDDRSLGGHGPLPQPQPQSQGQPQAQSQAQPQAQPSAHPPLQLPPPPPSLSRGQQAQPQASAPATRNSTEYSAPRTSRPHDERSAGHEKDHHQREGELLQHEVDAIDAYFYQQKTQLDKRQAVIDATRAHVRQREDNIATLEEKVRYYESEPYRQEVLSIRKHMQVNDVQEVSAITEKFRRITRKVEDISRDLGEKLSDSQAIREPTTKDLLTILLRRSATKQPGNVSVLNLPMDPEDFIDFGCRALLNDWLVERICGVNLFHPALAGRPENDLFLNTYSCIRRQEPQTIAGRWRVSTFNALKSHVCDPHAIAQEFCQNALVPLCGHVYKPEVYAEPVEVASGAIKELFKNTLDWTYLSKSSVVMLDFQPGFFSPGSPFDQQYAQLEGPGKHQPGPEGILLTSKLGLISSRAQGPHAQGIEYTLQVPAKVLASQYFS